MTPTQLMLGSLSDNAIRWATIIAALSMLGYAAQWAYRRERATATLAAAPVERELVGTGGPSSLGPVGDAAAPTQGDRQNAVDDAAAAADMRRLRRADAFARIGFNLLALCAVVLTAGVVCRGIAAERVPWSNMYEFATAGTSVILLAYLAVRRRLALGWMGFPLVSVVLVLLMLATIVLYTPTAGLIPALKSYWLSVHVTAAVLGTALFSLGAVASAAQLVRARVERRGSTALRRWPSAARIDAVAYRLNAFAFPIWTFALIAGAVWAQHAWGRFWGWDPKETWMFISWVGYAAYLHARATPGWRSRLPWLSLFAYATILFNLVGVNVFITGLHSYAGV